MGGWSQSASKLLNQKDTSTSIAPFSSGKGGTVPSNLLTSTGYFQPPNQDFANQLFGRKSGQAQQLYLADVLAQLGIGNLSAGAQTLQQPLNYYSGILSGDRQQALETVAPEVNTILGQYDTAKKAVSEYAPRGGGTATTMANAPYALSGQITNLLNTVRPQAAQATTGIGQFLDTLGTTQTGQSEGLINANVLAQLAKTGQQSQYAGLLGGALGGILPSLLGLIPHAGTPGATGGAGGATGTVLPSLNLPTPSTPDSAPGLPSEGSGVVPTPPFSLYPTVPPFAETAEAGAAGAGGAATLAESAAPAGAATSSILGFENPITGAFIGSDAAAGGAAGAGTAGGLAPEAGLLGTDIPTGSMFAPEGAYGSFAGVGSDAGGAGASGATGAESGGGLLSATGPAAIGGGLALGAGLPLAVLSLLGYNVGDLVSGTPSKGTQQNVQATESPVIKSFVSGIQGATDPATLNDWYNRATQYVKQFASGQGGWYGQAAQQQLQMIQQAYQQQLSKLQAQGG